MVRVELIFDQDCPNARAARSALRKAFEILGQEPFWQEWDRSDPECPDYVKHWGSPTVLINGIEISNAMPSHTKACRIYKNNEGRHTGIPPLSLIINKLTDAGRNEKL